MLHTFFATAWVLNLTILGCNWRTTTEVAPAPHHCGLLFLHAVPIVRYCGYFECNTKLLRAFLRLICFWITEATANKLHEKQQAMSCTRRDLTSNCACALISGFVASAEWYATWAVAVLKLYPGIGMSTSIAHSPFVTFLPLCRTQNNFNWGKRRK